jgi:antitoxin component of RelBE/YafQ-DinJ toxin-antitoxin module
MNKETTFNALVNVYLDEKEGLMTKQQLKLMIKQIAKKTALGFEEFAELCLDAQWHQATEEDYKKEAFYRANN